jgi:hypothetical protein
MLRCSSARCLITSAGSKTGRFPTCATIPERTSGEASFVAWAAGVPTVVLDERPLCRCQHLSEVARVVTGRLHTQLGQQEPEHCFDAHPAVGRCTSLPSGPPATCAWG